MSILIVNASQIPIINSYLTDNAGALSRETKTQLEKELRDLEKQTNGVQYVIFIENEFPKEYSLEEYTLKIAEANKIGKKGNDNGILLYIAIKDRKYRLEVGYGVESTLNSALIGRISREYLVPNFQNNDYEKGILDAFDVTKRILLGSNDADIVKLKGSNTDMSPSETIFYFILFVLFVLFVILFVSFVIMRFYFALIPGKSKIKKGNKYKDNIYTGAAGGIFAGGFGSGGSGGFGGFSGGGGGFGGGGFGGKF